MILLQAKRPGDTFTRTTTKASSVGHSIFLKIERGEKKKKKMESDAFLLWTRKAKEASTKRT